MSGTICTCKRGISILHSGVSTRGERDILWELYKRERNGMRGRGNNTSSDDGNSVYGICVTIRANVIMRGDSDM